MFLFLNLQRRCGLFVDRIDYDVCTVRSYVVTLNKRVIYTYVRVLYYSSTLELESRHYVNTVGGVPQKFLRCLVVCVCYQAATRHGWSVPKAPLARSSSCTALKEIERSCKRTESSDNDWILIGI